MKRIGHGPELMTGLVPQFALRRHRSFACECETHGHRLVPHEAWA